MAAKKYVCKVCGYTHEGNEAPSLCPLCKAGASEFEAVKEAKKKGFDTNSDLYAIIYSAVVVVIVAFLLAGVSSVLKPMQDANIELDKKKQILASLNEEPGNPALRYDELIEADYIVNAAGALVAEEGGFKVENDDINEDNLPLYIAKDKNGNRKYIIPMTGNGLWGGIWGYIALNNDCNTIYGVYFSHASETPGLGAEIAGDKFQSRFTKETDKDGNVIAKKVFDENGEVLLEVKKGKGKVGAEYHIDAVSGATLTCNGLDDMLKRKLAPYYNYLNNVKVAGEPEELDDENFAGEDAGEETLGEDIEGAFETEDENVESETGDEQVTEDASVQVNEEI